MKYKKLRFKWEQDNTLYMPNTWNSFFRASTIFHRNWFRKRLSTTFSFFSFFIKYNSVCYVNMDSCHKTRIILSKIKLEISARNFAIKSIEKLDNASLHFRKSYWTSHKELFRKSNKNIACLSHIFMSSLSAILIYLR